LILGASALSKLSKILVVGPAWVGDMVMAQSLFRVIKQLHPNALLDVLAPEWSRPLLERMPEVHEAIAIPIGHGVLNLGVRYSLAQILKQKNYDQAMVLPNSWKSALIPWLAKIPKRTGFVGEMRWGLLNDARVLHKAALPLMVQRFVALAYKKGSAILKSQCPPPQLKTDPKNIENALQKFAVKGDQPILALCPGAEFGPSKRWPENYYADVANEKLKQGWSVLLFGSKNDIPVCQAIQQQTGGRCIDLTGKTSLGEAIDLLSHATAVVTNDSGLMHIAAALDKPLIAVYGSTDPSFTPPLNQQSQVVRLGLACSPCFKRDCPLGHHRCMKDLAPEKVISALAVLER
jgi:heptosyltransferase-2